MTRARNLPFYVKACSFTLMQETLLKHFGFGEFRGPQKQIIEATLAGQSSLVVMPTGMGKSLCYQLPSLVLPGLTLVLSPLIALMKDQVDKALQFDIRAGFINSSLNSRDKKQAYEKLAEQQYQLLFVTPERFRNTEFLEAIKKNQISLLAIDEAHCISQWGHDFRPDYSKVGEIRKTLGDPQVLALTATATETVQEDIVKQLNPEEDEEFKKFIFGFERPNLDLQVIDLYGIDQKIQAIVMRLNQHSGSAIIYFSLVDTLKKFSYQLEALGFEHVVYHGQLPDRIRKRHQDMFIKNKAQLILATPAFGLGVDKPDVRQVIHAEIPGSIEAYYQEVGRAGRDGLDAFCTLLLDDDDISIQADFIKWTSPDPGFIRSVYNLLEDHCARVKVEGVDFLREKLNFYNRRDFRVETSLNLLERWGCISRLQHKPNDITVIKPPPVEFLNKQTHETKLETQNRKLLDMVQLAKLPQKEIKPRINEYFGVY